MYYYTMYTYTVISRKNQEALSVLYGQKNENNVHIKIILAMPISILTGGALSEDMEMKLEDTEGYQKLLETYVNETMRPLSPLDFRDGELTYVKQVH